MADAMDGRTMTHAPSVAHVTTIDLSLRYLLLNQLRSLRAAGYRVYGISSPGPDVPVIEAAGIPHIPVTMTRAITPWRDLVTLWRLYRVMRARRFDIVHTHNPKPGLLGQIAARLAGVPFVVNTLHGFYFHERSSWRARTFYVALEKLAARCSDVILSQSAEDMQTAIRLKICPPSKIVHLGNGIDLARFDPESLAPGTRERMRAGLGFGPEHAVVGFVGRLVREKGIPELLEALADVRRAIPQVRALFVGPTDELKADAVSPDLAKRLGLADICVFTGLRTDMPGLYAAMDVFVLPSHREGVPRSPMEASAMGLPCVVTDVRGCREVVEEGRNGLRVPVRSPSALSEAIRRILSDTVVARRMGEEGRRVARERFDEQQVFERVRAAYSRLLPAGYRSQSPVISPAGTPPSPRSGDR